MVKDSPQPQVPFALGLLNTKCSDNLSWTKSISDPNTVINAFESTNTVTPTQCQHIYVNDKNYLYLNYHLG